MRPNARTGWWRRLWTEQSGATAVEYSILVAAIAAAITAISFKVGLKTQSMFDALNDLY